MNWSASSTARLFACPTSALLPQQDYTTQYAVEGREYHAEQEAAADLGGELHPDVDALIRDGDELITELAFAYDVATDTARELGRIPRREYNVTETEIPGTPDLIIRGNGRIIIVDHKGHEAVDPADQNTQAATYALMVARAWGYDEAEVAIVYRATYRRPSHATLKALDLAAHAERLVMLRKDIEEARVTPQMFLNDGPWCKYCPAFLSGCPRQESLARRVSAGAFDTVSFQDDDEAARAFDLLGRLKQLTARVSAALYARAAERPIPLPDGRVFGQVKKLGARSLDGDAAYQLLREKYGQEVADRAVTREATQKGIEDALKEAGVKGAAAAKRSVVDELEAAGKVTRKERTVVEVYEPMKEIA